MNHGASEGRMLKRKWRDPAAQLSEMRVTVTVTNLPRGGKEARAAEERFTAEVTRSLPGADVSRNGGHVYVYARCRDADAVDRGIGESLAVCRLTAAIDVARWDEITESWLLWRGSRQPLEGGQSRAGQRRRITLVEVKVRTNAWIDSHKRVAGGIAFMASAVLAAAGIIWFALAPGVASYNIGGLMCAPAVAAFSVALSWWVPTVIAWGVAILAAIGGGIAYLKLGGDNVWFIGQMAALPLLMLYWQRYPGSPDGLSGEGPWGPP